MVLIPVVILRLLGKWKPAFYIVILGIGVSCLEDRASKVRFIISWLVGALASSQDTATLGTLLFYTDLSSYKRVRPIVISSISYVPLWWLTHTVSKILLRTAVDWGDRLPFWSQIQSVRRYVTRVRLNHEVFWVLRSIFLVNNNGRKAREWIAQRVEQENQKASEHKLDRYIHADNLKQCPSFESDAGDTEDLDFLCSEKPSHDLLHRSVRDAFIDTAIRNKRASDPMKPAALEALAHLSYLQSLTLKTGERLRLAQEFVELTRSALKRELDRKVASDLFTGLAGLANLAKRDAAGVGSFLKREHVFSVVAALLNPSIALVACWSFAGDKQAESLQPHFEHRDSGYSPSELSSARKRVRRSKADSSVKARKPDVHRADPPEALFVARSLDTSWSLFLSCLLYSSWRFLTHLNWEPSVKSVTHKFRVGVWYGLLTAVIRLISNLSTEWSNHAWLLEQGALQAVAKILRYLPADRMRSGQQEAALLVYRLFENPAVRAIARKSQNLKAAVSDILFELRAIDSDVLSAQWGKRIGSQLYKELRSDASCEARTTKGSGQETRPSSSRKKGKKTRPEDAVGSENPPDDERCTGTNGGTAEAGSASSSPPSSSGQPEREAMQPSDKNRRTTCAREGCTMERQPGVRLKVCAGCKKTRYCSKDCQIADFPSHRVVCKV